MRKYLITGVAAVVILATGCAEMSDTQRRTATGAGVLQQSSPWCAWVRPWLLACACLLTLAACDQQKISELTPGADGMAEVQAKWGPPEAVWDGANGEQILEYNRQPAGRRNWQVVLGADGKLLRTEQVLNPRNFAQVQPGMPMEAVRKLLGKPAKATILGCQSSYLYSSENTMEPYPSCSLPALLKQ